MAIYTAAPQIPICLTVGGGALDAPQEHFPLSHSGLSGTPAPTMFSINRQTNGNLLSNLVLVKHTKMW